MKASPNGFVDGAEPRLMIARDKKFELWRVLEEVLPHETGRDWITTCQGLDAALGPGPPFFSFSHSHKARTLKTCQFGWVTICV